MKTKIAAFTLSAFMILILSACNNDEAIFESNTITDYSVAFEQKVDDYLTSVNFNGSVVIAKDNHAYLSKSYGMADFENGILNDKNTQFYIGSISKPITTYAIMKLYQEGLLSFTDTLDMYFPDYPNGNKITIHHLMTHTSGLFDIMNLSGLNDLMHKKVSLSDQIDRFKDMGSFFEPGAKFQYSNSGIIILAAIIEEITDMSYQDFIHENVFIPLDMNSSGLNINGEILPQLAKGYHTIDNSLQETIDFIHPSFSHAAGGIHATAEDLYKWLHSINNNVQLSTETTEIMLSPKVGDTFGYGWFISDNSFYHRGIIHSYHSYVYSDQTNGITLVLLCNTNRTLSDISNTMKTMIYEFLTENY